jgi:hypothetical protein
MKTLDETARRASYNEGNIIIQMESGLEVRFPIVDNPRLSQGTAAQLNHIELSPFGIHWPDLDEDLSFRGIFAGNFGQKPKTPSPTIQSSRPPERPSLHAE